MLTREMMIWFWQQYLKDEKLADLPIVSPLRADNLRNLPPALVLTAEYDPLCDEGEAYAEKLKAAGVSVNLSRYEGVVHGFFRMTSRLDKARQALEEVSTAIRQALRS
jgi:acetyl esterase